MTIVVLLPSRPSDLNQLAKLHYKTLKTGAVGESTGFKFLWIPFASPSETDAKRDMLERLQKEGINTSGKNVAFANATSDRGGFGFIGLIGAPTITLSAESSRSWERHHQRRRSVLRQSALNSEMGDVGIHMGVCHLQLIISSKGELLRMQRSI